MSQAKLLATRNRSVNFCRLDVNVWGILETLYIVLQLRDILLSLSPVAAEAESEKEIRII